MFLFINTNVELYLKKGLLFLKSVIHFLVPRMIIGLSSYLSLAIVKTYTSLNLFVTY